MATRNTTHDDSSSNTPNDSAALERVDLLFTRLLINSYGDANAKDEDGITLLQHASYRGTYELVKLISEKGVDINTRGDDGITTLHEASLAGFVTIVQFLLE